MKDVAARLGLSRCTVSNILNNKMDGKSYRSETIDLVRRTAKEMGYVANNIAKSLKTGYTGTIAIVVPDLANPFYIKVIKEVERLANATDFSLIICIAEEKLEKEEQALTMLQSRRVDGVIISPVSYEASLVKKYPFPIVCFDRTVKNNPHPSVLIDNECGAEQLTTKLLRQSARAPLFIGQSKLDYTMVKRLAGYKKALAKKHIRFEREKVVYDVFDNATAYNSVLRLIEQAEADFDSILLSSNYYVYGVLQALAERKITVKSMGGFEHFNGEVLLGSDMVIVDQREADLGTAAFNALVRSLRGERPEDVEIKTVVERVSIF